MTTIRCQAARPAPAPASRGSRPGGAAVRRPPPQQQQQTKQAPPPSSRAPKPPAQTTAMPSSATPTAPGRAASLAAAAQAVAGTKALRAELAAAQAKIAELERELAAARPPPPPPPPPPATTTTILYRTGWTSAYAHLSADGGPWTAAPGVELPAPGPADGAWRVLVVPTSGRVEVVFTDGGGAWDTPDPDRPRGVNYVVDGGGVWTVRRGEAARVAVPAARAADPGAGGWGWVQ